MDAQLAFFDDLSKSLLQSFQNMCELNIQLGRHVFEESKITSQQMLAAGSPADAMAVAVSRAQPASQSLMAYQQHVSKAAAATQIDLARVSQQHAEEMSRTARVLADEVKQVAVDETERGVRMQQEAFKTASKQAEANGAGKRP